MLLVGHWWRHRLWPHWEAHPIFFGECLLDYGNAPVLRVGGPPLRAVIKVNEPPGELLDGYSEIVPQNLLDELPVELPPTVLPMHQPVKHRRQILRLDEVVCSVANVVEVLQDGFAGYAWGLHSTLLLKY